MRRLSLSLSLLLALAGCRATAAPTREPVRVAAASDLTKAFTELGRAFEAKTGHQVAFTFGSTGLLARQLKERAPFDVFASASASFVDDVVRAGACDGATRALYGRGRLVVFTKGAPGADTTRSLDQLADPSVKRIALANPEHAPYGKAAREALSRAGLWAKLEPRVVYAENVRQTLQLAESGNVEAALVALSLVIDGPKGSFTLIDDGLHGPIEQTLVACQGGKQPEAGRAFAAFVGSKEGRAVMRRYGFLLPGESLAAQ